MAKYSREQIRELPEDLQNHYYDSAVGDKYFEEIFPMVDEEKWDMLRDLVLDVYFRNLTVDGFVDELKKLVPDQEKSAVVITKILGYDFMPLADYFNSDVITLITENGGDPLLFRTKVSVTEVAKQMRKKSKEVTMSSERLEKRLLNILRSKASNARTDDQVKEMLMGSTKTSGVGLDEGQAAIVMMYASEEAENIKKRGIDIVSDEQYAKEGSMPAVADIEEPRPESEPVAAAGGGDEQDKEVKEEPKSKPKKPQLDAFNKEDKKEIDDVKKKYGTQEVTRKEKAIEFTLEGLSDAALDSSGMEFDEDMHKRFRYIVDLYYRDLRDGLETKSKLTMPTQSGGMGMDDGQVAKVMALLKKRIGEYRKFMQTKVSADKERFVNKQNERQMEGAEREEKHRKARLDKRFKELTGKEEEISGVSEDGAEEQAPTVPKVIEVVSHDEEEKEEGGVVAEQDAVSTADETVQSVREDDVEEASKTVPPPTDLPEVSESEAGPDAVVSDEKPVHELPPEPAVAQVSPSPVTQQTAKPVVSDVKFTPKLTGPVEELRVLTLVDFRRLSKDPKEATLKIMDKIELLQNTSFEMKTDGVKAWQESPANTAYLDVLRTSLEGKPVVDVLDEMVKKDPDAVTKLEFEALMDLNRTIRFG